MIEKELERLFDLGGLIAGGAAVAYLFNSKDIHDLDFFFNDWNNYSEALKCKLPSVDIVYYELEKPYDTFDLNITKCYLDRRGKLHMDKICQQDFKNNIITIDRNNIICPVGTFRRLIKYQVKYNLKINKDDQTYIKKLLCNHLSNI